MKSRIKRILCPIDFTDASNNALEYSAQLAQRLNSSLTLWNMCEIPILDELSSKISLPNDIAKKQEELSEILREWCEEIKGEYNISCGYSVRSSSDSLEQTLAHYVDGENFDLIITGTNGIDDMYQFFFGTNSYKIIRSVRCPVMVIPMGYTFRVINSVLFATDYSEGDASLAKDLMNSFETNISFVHVSSNESFNSNDMYHSFRSNFDEKHKDEKIVQFKHLVNEDKAHALISMMFEEESDLLIMSTVNRTWIENIFHKSFTRQVLEGIKIPALVFHQKDD